MTRHRFRLLLDVDTSGAWMRGALRARLARVLERSTAAEAIATGLGSTSVGRVWLGLGMIERDVLYAEVSGDDGRAQPMPVSVRREGDALVVRDDGGGRLFGVALIDDTPCAFTWRDGCDDDAEIVATLPLHGPAVERAPWDDGRRLARRVAAGRALDGVHGAPARDVAALDALAVLLSADVWTPDHADQVARIVRGTGRPIAEPAEYVEVSPPEGTCDDCTDADGVPIRLRWSWVCPACEVSHHGAPCTDCGRRGYHRGGCDALCDVVLDDEREARS